MSAMSNGLEQDFLAWLFQATAPAWNAATNLYVSLHTADPGEGGSQNTSEATYTGYARVAVVRTSGGWQIVSSAMTNVAAVTFGACTAGANTLTYIGIGTASSGAGTLLMRLALTASLSVSSGITPVFDIAAISLTAD